MHKLVYINYNQRLSDRFQKRNQEATGYDPISVNDMNFSSEWVTGYTGPSNEFVYDEEGLRWADVWEASGVPEQEGPSTRSRIVVAQEDAFLTDPVLNDDDNVDFDT